MYILPRGAASRAEGSTSSRSRAAGVCLSSSVRMGRRGYGSFPNGQRSLGWASLPASSEMPGHIVSEGVPHISKIASSVQMIDPTSSPSLKRLPLNKGRQEAISENTAPVDQTSTPGPERRDEPNRISGARYHKVTCDTVPLQRWRPRS